MYNTMVCGVGRGGVKGVLPPPRVCRGGVIPPLDLIFYLIGGEKIAGRCLRHQRYLFLPPPSIA